MNAAGTVRCPGDVEGTALPIAAATGGQFSGLECNDNLDGVETSKGAVVMYAAGGTNLSDECPRADPAAVLAAAVGGAAPGDGMPTSFA